jgi:hypothetical protein
MTSVLALPPAPNIPGFTDVDARNPAQLGFPPMLPYELAMKTDTAANICRAYGMTREQFTELIAHPTFIKAYQEAIEALKVDGMGFKVKARMQAEAYLDTAFHMAQNPGTSDSVRADIIKNTVRWAGFDAKAAEVGQGNSFNIQINLG